MGLFSKKEEIPQIPAAPTLATFPNSNPEKNDLPELPSFPSNSSNENLNQEIVKSVVSETDSPREEEASAEGGSPPVSGEILAPTADEVGGPTQEPERLEAEPEEAKPVEAEDEVAPIFVRVDKFQSAQKHFEEIKLKVQEIEATLKKIKEIKLKEDEELDVWNSEIEKLKLRLAEIDSDIFSQI